MISSGPNQNFVEVERDFSDLESKMENLLRHRGEAERIANNSAELFRDRYLTPAAQACYWRRMFKAWASVSFEPAGWVRDDGEDGQIRRRGTPFESFA